MTADTSGPDMHADQLDGDEEDLDDFEDMDEGEGDEDSSINIVNDGDGCDEETKHFDRIIGALEDILMDEEFEQSRETFCRENCVHFEDTPENKLVYMELFSRYTALLESMIESRLTATVPGFDMQEFLGLLDAKKDELMSDMCDLLLSLGDFESFRELMLSYKQDVEQAGPGLQVACCALRVHTEEQEDGEARPDLDLGLTISPVGLGPGRITG